MRDLLILLGVIGGFIFLVVGIMVAVTGFNLYYEVKNSEWNCREYAEVAPTKMIAGSCYVQDKASGKWVLFHSYVNQLNVQSQ